MRGRRPVAAAPWPPGPHPRASRRHFAEKRCLPGVSWGTYISETWVRTAWGHCTKAGLVALLGAGVATWFSAQL